MTAKNQHTAWIFDVDGVLVHLEKRQLVEKDLITHILNLLQQGDLVAFASGRSTHWQRENVIKLLEDKAKEQGLSMSLLDRVFISGEFGGTRIYFHEGHERDEVNKDHVIPKDVFEELLACVEPFLHDFILEPKQTIFTIFTKKLKTFSTDCPILVAKFQTVIDTHSLQEEIEVHADTSAINVKYKRANKRYATEQILSWIQGKNQEVEHIYAFGDNLSDLEIGEELTNKNLLFTFVYVGDPTKLPKNLSFPITKTQEHFDKGTLEFLKQFS